MIGQLVSVKLKEAFATNDYLHKARDQNLHDYMHPINTVTNEYGLNDPNELWYSAELGKPVENLPNHAWITLEGYDDSNRHSTVCILVFFYLNFSGECTV